MPDACLAVQLDSLKAYPNVLVLTTSNITGAIDLAFLDRADIKAYVGPPGLQVSPDSTLASALICDIRMMRWCRVTVHSSKRILQARYEILRSCMAELQRVGILAPQSYSPLPYAMLSPASVVCCLVP